MDTHLGIKIISRSRHSPVPLHQIPLPWNPDSSLFLQRKCKPLIKSQHKRTDIKFFANVSLDRAVLALCILLTFPPLVNLWIWAMAMPGTIRHAAMMPTPGKISYHMMTDSNCPATKGNFEDNNVALRLHWAAYFANWLTKCRPLWRPAFGSGSVLTLPVGFSKHLSVVIVIFIISLNVG